MIDLPEAIRRVSLMQSKGIESLGVVTTDASIKTSELMELLISLLFGSEEDVVVEEIAGLNKPEVIYSTPEEASVEQHDDDDDACPLPGTPTVEKTWE